MNLTKYFSLAVIFALAFACKEIDKLATFEVKDSAEFTIPASVGINTPVPINTPDVQTSAKQTFANNNTDTRYVKDVKLSSLGLVITSPTSQTFQFLKNVEIYLSADGLPEVLIASKYNIPTSVGGSLNLDVADQKLDEYIKKDSYNIKTNVTTRQVLSNNVTVKANLAFKVTAKIIN